MKQGFLLLTVLVASSIFSLAATPRSTVTFVKASHHDSRVHRHHAHKAGKHHTPKHPHHQAA